MKLVYFVTGLLLMCAFSVTASAQTTFSNTNQITIRDNTTANPYPSNITVSGVTGNVTKVTVRINGLTHSWSDDIGILLVGPTGVKVRLMTDVGWGSEPQGVNLTFDDAGNPLPDSDEYGSGTYRPTQGTGGPVPGTGTGNAGPPHPENFAAPAPAGPYSLTLSSFNNVDPNGTWSLYVDDDGSGDTGFISGGWTLNITTGGGGTPTPTPTPQDAPVDFNGDGKTDYAVARNVGTVGTTANQVRWFYNINGSNAPTAAFDWGINTDAIVPEDYDGDGKDDIAVWRPGAATVAAFYILNSATNTARVEPFGQTGDDPTVVGDYNGDGKADLAVYRPGAATGDQSTWFYRVTPGGSVTFVPWGIRGDAPAPGDYDGDGKNDFVVYRNNGDAASSLFWTKLATGTVLPVQPFGRFNTDYVVPGDYDGDGKTDLAVIRGSGGAIQWIWKRSSDSVMVGPVSFGSSAGTDGPAQGDYDGDGRTDIAIWRNNGQFIWRSTATGVIGFFTLGANGDFPVAAYNRH